MSKAAMKLTELASSLLGTELEEHRVSILIGMIGNLFDEKGGVVSENDIIKAIEEREPGLKKCLKHFKEGDAA